MPVSLYDITVPVFIRSFGNLRAILEKGRAFADGNGMTHEELTAARLFPDMLPLTGQIQRASDTARFVAVRVAGAEAVSMADEERNFDDMQARIAATVDYLQKVDAASFDGAEGREVVMKTQAGELRFTGTSYILQFALPNFYFHVTTAYDILRHKGVPLTKPDFLRGG
jgi:hypothetical protein